MPTWVGECAALFPLGSLGVVLMVGILAYLIGFAFGQRAGHVKARPAPPPPARPISAPLPAHHGIIFGTRLAQALGVDPTTVKKIVLTAGGADGTTAEFTQVFFDGDKIVEAVRTMRLEDTAQDPAIDPLTINLAHFPRCARGEHMGDCFDRLGNRLWMGGAKDGTDRQRLTR